MASAQGSPFCQPVLPTVWHRWDRTTAVSTRHATAVLVVWRLTRTAVRLHSTAVDSIAPIMGADS